MTRRRMITGWLAISLAVTLLLGVGAYKFSNSRRFQAFGELIQRVETTDKVVALTFDDGPTPGDTEAVLKTLTAHNVSATFFLCGAEMAAHPSQTKLIVDAGHQVGNHSWSHQRMWFLTPNSVRKELDDTDLEIRNSGYEERIDFRPRMARNSSSCRGCFRIGVRARSRGTCRPKTSRATNRLQNNSATSSWTLSALDPSSCCTRCTAAPTPRRRSISSSRPSPSRVTASSRLTNSPRPGEDQVTGGT